MEQTPSELNEEAPSDNQNPVMAPESQSAPVVPVAAAPIQIPPKVLAQAKALGVDLGQIVDWAKSMEEFKAVTMKNFEIIQSSFNELKPLVQLSREVEQARAQTQATGGTTPQTGGFDLSAFLKILPSLMGGGDNQFAELGKKALMSQINMSNAITNAVVAKIAGKATSGVAEAVTGG